jgi:hypothetical protein
MRTSIILGLVLATATVANGNLAMPFPYGGPQLFPPVLFPLPTLMCIAVSARARGTDIRVECAW